MFQILMEFKFIETTASTIKKKGYWPPLFKTRFTENYYDVSMRDEYEANLFERIFGNNNEKIIINLNTYPFNLGFGLTQYIVWIRNMDNDPGIDYITEFVNQIFPDMDYVVYLNKPEGRSIKTILHYHVIIKNSHEPIFLKKLIVLHHHGNTSPIYHFPFFEKILGRSANTLCNLNPNLLLCGFDKAIHFGTELKNIYELDQTLINNSIFLSLPFDECRETSKGIICGLNLAPNTIVIDSNKLNLEIFSTVELFSQQITDMELMYDKYVDLMTQIETCVGLEHKYTNNILTPNDKIIALAYIYDYHQSLQYYKDLGMNVDDFIDISHQKILADAYKNIYNILCNIYQKILLSDIHGIISYAKKFDKKLVMCSVNNDIIFTLTKYFAAKNKIDFQFEPPDYLANIRIEEWSNGMIRIYYNDWYLGFD
jgi:hypothetical protein